MEATKIILSMGGLAVVASVGESIAEVLGQTKIANYIRVGAVSGGAITAIGLVVKALSMLKGI